jgi:uncharacterized protein (DUF433 family)
MTQSTEVYPGVADDPATHHGKPIIAGTRIAAQTIVELLAAGETQEAVMDAYHLTTDQVRAALGYAADRLAAETVYVVPAAS